MGREEEMIHDKNIRFTQQSLDKMTLGWQAIIYLLLIATQQSKCINVYEKLDGLEQHKINNIHTN